MRVGRQGFGYTELGRSERMAGGGHGHGGDHGHGITYNGFTMHHPNKWHARTGKFMCAVMWFWILYRAKEDGPVLLGMRHPWESHGHGHSHEHAHAHEEDH